MKVRHLLVLAPVSLVILACGPAPDDSNDPPKIIGGLMGEVSPFDTLQVEFTTDLKEFAKSQIVSDRKLMWSQRDEKVNIFGDSTYVSGFQMLEPGKEYNVSFKNLESTDGAVQNESQSVQFTTMPLLDKDAKKDGKIINNGEYSLAEKLASETQFFNGTKLTTGLSVAGIIHGMGNGQEDTDDWFEVKLKKGDSLDVKLTNLKANLQVRMYGPEDATGNISDSIDVSDNKGNEDEHLVCKPGAERHSYGTNHLEDYLSYWIRVSPSGNSVVRSSYVLTVKKLVK